MSRSYVEAEYRSLAATNVELTWLLGLLKKIGVEVTQPVTIHSDHKGSIKITANAENHVFRERTEHIKIDFHFMREKIQQGIIKTQYIGTKEQPADILTKALTKVQNDT